MRKDKALLKFLSNPVVIRRHYSPSISRSIPAPASELPGNWLNEWTVVVIVCGILMYLIVAASLQINTQIIELSKKQAMRQGVIKELAYWEKITTDYPNYRDGYFRIALLHYQLGDVGEARSSVETALRLDPRFPAGTAFLEKLTSE